MSQRHTYRLSLPRLQLKLIAAFLLLSTISLLLQYILVMSTLADVAGDLPSDGLLLLDGLTALLARIFLVSAGVLLPLTFMVGLLATHRFAGPIYRFQVFLKQVNAGQKPADCKLRKGDELQELCTLINQATAAARSGETTLSKPAVETSRLRAAG